MPPKGRENPMNLLTRLAYTQHPRPPQSELRQRGVFDSGARLIGQVMHIYVDDRHFRFIGVAMRKGFVSFGKKHHLVPIEAIAEAEPDSITLKVDQQAVESAHVGRPARRAR